MTIILDGDGRTSIDRRAVTVHVSGLSTGEVRLVVLDGQREAFGVIRQRPGVTVLPRVDRALTLQVRPERRAEFAAGSAVSVRVTTEPTADSAGDDVVVQAVDVSGLPRRDIVVIDVEDGQRLSVTALHVVRDEPLGLLADAARATARAHLRETPVDPVAVRVGVDLSASMAPALARRSVDAVLDVVAGLAPVLAPDTPVEAYLLDGGIRPLRAVAPGQLTATTRAALDRAGLGCGFRSAPPGPPPRGASLTFVVTDAVPADVGALRAAHRPGDERHLVLLADGGEPDPPESCGLPITRLQQDFAGDDAVAWLAGDQVALSDLVGSLLAGRRT
jgi:hypothetical protein